jgi:peptidoglycan/LPS O-acetylase OafA/YrhL
MIKSRYKNHYTEIDGIRGLCAMLLLLHHYTKYIYDKNQEQDLYYHIMDYGRYGVHFFFVISGFLIFMTLEKARHPKDFIISRFSRLYPGYWVCILLTTAVSFSPYFPFHTITLNQFLANLTMFQHWMFIEDIDGVYWTLAVELCFYVMIFLVFIARQQKNIERIGIVWMAIMLLNYYGAVYLSPNNTININYYLPLLKNGTLFFGGILFYQLKNGPAQKRKYVLLLLTLLVHLIINSIEETMVILLVYFILYLFVTDKLQIMRGKVFYYIGIISYSLYLLHQYIGYVIINFLNYHGITNTALEIIITGILLLILSLTVAFGIERPVMRFLRNRFLQKN